MLEYFLSLPTFLMFLVATIIGSSISIIALLIVRKKLNWEAFQENHEVGGFLFNALGLIYAVLIAFVVYATWSEYNSAKIICENEANTAMDLYIDSEGLPPSAQQAIREKIMKYLKQVIEQDWPLLSKEESNPESRQTLIELSFLYSGMDSINTEKEQIYFAESLGKLNSLAEFRRLRLLSSQSHIPAVIWTVIILGSLTSIGFSLFFGTKNIAIQAAMTSLFAMTNAIVIVMILALDHPFTGDIKIKPEAFMEILNNLTNYFPK